MVLTCSRSPVLSEAPADTLLGINYPNGQDVALGNKLTPEQASQAPEIMFVPDDSEAYYTLIMVQFEFLHMKILPPASYN